MKSTSVCPLNTSLCVRSKCHRVYRHHAHTRFNTCTHAQKTCNTKDQTRKKQRFFVEIDKFWTHWKMSSAQNHCFQMSVSVDPRGRARPVRRGRSMQFENAFWILWRSHSQQIIQDFFASRISRECLGDQATKIRSERSWKPLCQLTSALDFSACPSLLLSFTTTEGPARPLLSIAIHAAGASACPNVSISTSLTYGHGCLLTTSPGHSEFCKYRGRKTTPKSTRGWCPACQTC